MIIRSLCKTIDTLNQLYKLRCTVLHTRQPLTFMSDTSKVALPSQLLAVDLLHITFTNRATNFDELWVIQ